MESSAAAPQGHPPSLPARLRGLALAFTEPHPALAGEARRQARLLSALLAAAIPLSVTASLAAPALAGPAGPLLAQPVVQQGLATCALGLVAFALSRTRLAFPAALLTVVLAEYGIWSAVVASADPVHEAAAPFFLGISVILAALLLPPRWTLGVAAANLAGVLALPALLPSFGPFRAANAALLLGFITAFIAVFAAVRRRDLRHIEAQARGLEEREERLRAIVTNAPDVILLVDRAGTIGYINRTAPGLTPEGVVGTNLGDYVGAAETAAMQERLGRVFATGQTEAYEAEAEGPWGQRAWYASRLGPIFQDGKVTAATLITTDVTRLKEAEAERARGRERALELARLREAATFRNNFLNMAAHELRTPMTPIKTQLYILRRRRDAEWREEERRAFDMLERNVARLAGLLRDVLDGARLESGHVALRNQALDLAQVAAVGVELRRAEAASAGLTLTARLDEALPVRGDPERLGQVLTLLLDNAIRYTPTGGTVHIEAACEAGQAVLRVRDSGLGLGPEQLAKLFQPFSQMRFGVDQSGDGTGLGMFIAKGIAELHGGRLECASEGPGKGSTFCLLLPLAPLAVADPPDAASPPRADALTAAMAGTTAAAGAEARR